MVAAQHTPLAGTHKRHKHLSSLPICSPLQGISADTATYYERQHSTAHPVGHWRYPWAGEGLRLREYYVFGGLGCAGVCWDFVIAFVTFERTRQGSLRTTAYRRRMLQRLDHLQKLEQLQKTTAKFPESVIC